MALSRQHDPDSLSAAIHVPLCKELLFKAQEQKGNQSSVLSSLSLKDCVNPEKCLIMFNYDSLKGSVFLRHYVNAHFCSAHIGESVSDSFRILVQTCRQGTYMVQSAGNTLPLTGERSYISLLLTEKPQK